MDKTGTSELGMVERCFPLRAGREFRFRIQSGDLQVLHRLCFQIWYSVYHHGRRMG